MTDVYRSVKFLEHLDKDPDKRVPEDKQHLAEELAMLGMLHMGFNDTNMSDFHTVASVTPLGKSFIRIKKIEESTGLRRILYRLGRYF
jgi:hypothetical protein